VPSITIVHLVHAYDRRNTRSIWIVPGSLDDFNDDSSESAYSHITDYLSERGILIASKVKADAAGQIARNAIDIFRRGGIDAFETTLCDD
jgi:hypothetical protein